MQSTPIGAQKPFFSVMMRSIRITYILISLYHEILALQTEILITFLLELLSPELQEWQAAISLEVLHKLIVQPSLMAWFCENYDMQLSATKLVQMIVSKLRNFVEKMLEHGGITLMQIDDSFLAAIDDALNKRDVSSINRVSQTGFVYNGSFTPLSENLSAKRWIV
jgi:hypothetical protein